MEGFISDGRYVIARCTCPLMGNGVSLATENGGITGGNGIETATCNNAVKSAGSVDAVAYAAADEAVVGAGDNAVAFTAADEAFNRFNTVLLAAADE